MRRAGSARRKSPAVAGNCTLRIQDAAKAGALLSFLATVLNVVSAKLVGVKKMHGPVADEHGQGH